MKRWLVLMLMLVGCEWGSTPPDVPGAEAISRHNQAVAAMGAFNYQGAMDVLLPLAQAYPDWLDVQIDLSIAQLNRQTDGDDAAALDRLDRVLEIDPSDLRADYTAGILRLHAGQIDAAAEHFARVLAADPGDAYAAYHLGQARVQQGKVDEAIPLFAKAIEADPYLRSALYAGAQASRRMGMIEQAEIWLADFQRLEHNPRASLAEIKYTRMGPKAEVRALQAEGSAIPMPVPTGQIFEAAKARHIPTSNSPKGSHLSVGMQDPERSVVAIGSDQGLSLYVRTPEGITLAERMGSVEDVTASMWGDVNADGHLDLVLCRVGGSQLWLGHSSDGIVRSSEFLPKSQGAAVDGALFDADHDGDLDVLLISGDDTPSELMNNNGDGTWSSIVDEVSGFPANTTNARRVVVADFDGDLDTDVIIIRETAPHDVYLNDRLWNWTVPSSGWESLRSATITGAVAVDFDADGATDLITTDGAFNLAVWHHEPSEWISRPIADRSHTPPVLPDGMTAEKSLASDSMFAVADLTGDGDFEILAETGWTSSSKPVLKVINKEGLTLEHIVGSPQWTLVQGPIGKGPAYLGVEEDGGILEIPPGEGRWPFVDVILSGQTDLGQSMRSNSSGIGTMIAARVGDRWNLTGTVRRTAGPGQDLQPIAIGLGGADVIDFVSIDWTDGVYQTESMLESGKVHQIVETQRQLSSCPLIFAWDGHRMRFITDCLGVAGIGFLLEPGRYSAPRPRERVLLPATQIAPIDGVYELVLAEPMQETCYLDAIALEVIDVPLGWEVIPDERMGTGLPEPTSELLFSRRSAYPASARDRSGISVQAEIEHRDGCALDPGVLDARWLGRVNAPLELDLEFAEVINGDRPVLVIDGWVEYPYSQTMFAAWQAGITYRPVTIEAMDAGGTWQTVHEEVGYPAGMTRTSVLPLENLPEGTRRIRLSTDLEMYIDAVRIAYIEPCREAQITRVKPQTAVLRNVGYPTKAPSVQRKADFDWDDRVPFWDTRVQSGAYTRFGDVGSLVSDRDGAVGVFGAGEAVQFSFASPAMHDQNWNRQLVLDLYGWCKDMDLMTQEGARVDPVPGNGSGDVVRTRHRSGR